MKIYTKIVLKDLAGKEMEEATFGKALANIVVGAKEGGKMKLYVLGTKLFQDDVVEVDESDLSLLKSVVKSTEVYGALISGQCELLLEEIKEEKKPKSE